MEFNPHLLIEGIAISAFAIKSMKSFIYIRGEFSWIADILEKAIDEAKKAGLLDMSISSFTVVGGSFVCGDERLRSNHWRASAEIPGSNRHSRQLWLYGCPTVVNNVETLSNVP